MSVAIQKRNSENDVQYYKLKNKNKYVYKNCKNEDYISSRLFIPEVSKGWLYL